MHDHLDVQTLPLPGGLQLGHLRLQAERSLNALSLDMVRGLSQHLRRWQDDASIALVLIDGGGERAFCAGGDIRRLYQSISELPAGARNAHAENFFAEEYRLDMLIHSYSKPILVWAHGLVMGGGMGLLAGASHRVLTNSSRLAMPEISIGLFPDVGGSWFLNRMPTPLGRYLGLTGAALNAADGLWLGLADFYLEDHQRGDVLDALRQGEFDVDPGYNRRMLSYILRSFEAQTAPSASSVVQQHYSHLMHLGRGDSALEVVSQILADTDPNPWLSQARQQLQHGSPITAAIVFAQLEKARRMSLQQCFEMEFILALNCCQFGDLAEGVRARLIDKDQNPRWRYPHVAAVELEAFFEWPQAWGEPAAVFAST